jgi:hypothetical protein
MRETALTAHRLVLPNLTLATRKARCEKPDILGHSRTFSDIALRRLRSIRIFA